MTNNWLRAAKFVIFFIWEHEEDSLKQSIETLNAFHSTIKITVEWSKEEINILEANLRLRNRQLETGLHVKTAVISFLTQYLVTHALDLF